MVVLVEEQPLRALVTRVVGHEQVGAVGDEQGIGVERSEFLVHGDDVAVVALLERLRLGVAGQLAEEVLIAGGLAGIEVAVVEARVFEREIAAFGIDLASATPGPTHRPARRRERSRDSCESCAGRAAVA